MKSPKTDAVRVDPKSVCRRCGGKNQRTGRSRVAEPAVEGFRLVEYRCASCGTAEWSTETSAEEAPPK